MHAQNGRYSFVQGLSFLFFVKHTGNKYRKKTAIPTQQ